MSPRFAILLLKEGRSKANVFSLLRRALREEEAYVSQFGDFASTYEEVAYLINKAEISHSEYYLKRAQCLLDELP